jgi:hypothetical protein
MGYPAGAMAMPSLPCLILTGMSTVMLGCDYALGKLLVAAFRVAAAMKITELWHSIGMKVGAAVEQAAS